MRFGGLSRSIGTGLFLAILQLMVQPAMAQQPSEAPTTPPPGRGTDRPPPEAFSKLKTGPELAYKADPNWPILPAGYNFGEASGVDVDKQGNVWVFNRGHWPIMEFDRQGKMIQAWNSDTLHVTSAHGVRIDPDGNVWCIDVDGHAVFKLSPQGRILMVLGRQNTAGNNDSLDGFNRPTNVAFRSNGNFYISDGYVNSRIIEFTASGEYVKHWGTKGNGNGMFNLVHDAAVDSKGLVYVADRTNERVQVFDGDGKFIAKWDNLGAPWGLYYVRDENVLWMCDGKYNRILKLSLDGKILGQLSSWGKAPGKLDYVHSIAFDSGEGSIYTVEIKNWRVQKWVKQ